MRITTSMSDKEEELKKAGELVKKSKDYKIFESFIEAFKSAEEQHIRDLLNPEDPKDFNLRGAAVCAEAYAGAELMLSFIKDKE